MSDIAVSLNFDDIREIATRGVRRATVFMGIGTNAARNDPPISHVLDDKAQFVVVPPEISAESQRAFLSEFENWIIASGFRELIETFSVFLLELYMAHFLLERGRVDRKEYAMAKNKFERKNVWTQSSLLTNALGLDGRFSTMFESLNTARNCLAHRRGVVGPIDILGNDQTFNLRWRTRTVISEDGREISTLLNKGETPRIEKGKKIVFAEVERTKSFHIGESIGLNRHELNEICLGFTIATEVFIMPVINRAKAEGIIKAEGAES